MLMTPFDRQHLNRNTPKSIHMQGNMTGEITETVTVSMSLPAPSAAMREISTLISKDLRYLFLWWHLGGTNYGSCRSKFVLIRYTSSNKQQQIGCFKYTEPVVWCSLGW